MVAQVVNMTTHEYILSTGDTHLYVNQFEGITEQLSRNPLSGPTIELNPKIKEIDQFTFDDIAIIGYKHHERIKMPIAV